MTRKTLSLALSSLLLASAPALAHGPQDEDRADRDRTHVRPEAAAVTVRIDNDVGRAITITADGRQIAVVPAGSRERVTVPRSVDRLEARVGSRQVGLLRLDGRDATWEVERPTFTSVLINNPLPIAVVVTLDGASRTVASESSLLFSGVDVGASTIVTRRVSGELIDRETVMLSAFDDLRFQVERPDEGLVEVLNRWSTDLEVTINGRVVDVLEPGEQATYSVRAGRADVSLTRLDRLGREGAEVYDERLLVDRYETERIATGPSGRSHAHTHRPPRGVR